MTDGDWLSSADPDAMLRFVRDRVTDNDLRKFACACCRRIWHLLMDVRSRQALEVAERFIDGGATEDELKAAAGAALEAAHFDGSNGQEADAVAAAVCLEVNAVAASRHAAWALADRMADEAVDAGTVTFAEYEGCAKRFFDIERTEQATVLRTIVRNPFKSA